MPEPLTLAILGASGGGLLVGLARKQFRLFKAMLDLCGSVVLLALFSPVMLLCMVLIKWADPTGPAIYRQTRVGFHGQLITIYKLRTMYMDAEARGRAVRAEANDPRVIPVCRWMRRSHVDELPQLVNIICGQMSLVGPRPERPELVAELMRHLPDFHRRLTVKPGLTGLAQIKNGYDTDLASVRRKLEYDLHYIRSMSVGLELRLLLATVAKFNDPAAR